MYKVTTALSTILLAATFFAPSVLANSLANKLIGSAVQIPDGEYYLRNVGSKQQLTGNKNALYPVYGRGSPIAIAAHQRYHTVVAAGTGNDRKCLSAQWSGSDDGVGALYECVLGPYSDAMHSSLRPAKQQFLLVPAARKFKRSIVSEIVEERGLFDATEDGALEKRRHQTSYGPFYMIAVDHIDNMPPRAVQGSRINSLGQKVMQLVKWKSGNRLQMWEFVQA